MKQRLLKTMLLVAGLLLGANVAWADPTVLYGRAMTADEANGYAAWSAEDAASSGSNLNKWVGNFTFNETYGLYVSGTGSRASTMTFSHTANSIQTFDIVYNNLGNTGNANNYSYIKIGSDIEIQSNQQNQVGAVIINGVSNAISDCNLKNYNRGGDSWTIHVEVNTATNKVTALTIVGTEMNGKSAHFTLASETALSSSATYDNVTIGFNRAAGTPAMALTSIRVAEEAQAIATAPYTINYKNGEDIVKTVSAEIAVGTVVNVETTVWKDAKKYILSAGEPTSLTVESGSENVLNVKVEEAAIYTYNVNAKDGETIVKEIGNGSTYAGEEVTFAYPQYVLADGKLYAMATSNPDWYRTTFTPTATDFNVDLNVTGTPVDNAVFYSDAEDITGMTAADFTNRASKGQVARTADIDTYVDVTTLVPGKYQIFVRGLNGNSTARAFKAKVGETVVWDNWSIAANGTNQLGNSEYFDVAESANLSIACEGSSASGLDWIYVVEAPKYKYTVNFVNGESVALKDPIQLEGYEGAAAAITDALKAKFDKDGVIYAYASDDAAEKTIAADGNTVVTIMFAVDTHFTEPMLTFQGRAGEEVSLTFGAWNTEDYYGVDFGDGTIQKAKVGIDNKGPKKEDGTTGSATEFKGTVGADGIIKVYGENDVWYLVSSGAMPTTLDQEKLKNVVQLKISGANVESVELPAYPKMTQFEFNNSPVKTLDVTKVTTLTSLSVDNTTQSQYAPALESIDLSANTELTYLKILGNATNKGKLAAIDLSKNTKLANVYLQDNAIKTAVMPEGAALTFLNLQNNELETIDLSVCASNKDVYLNNNKLKSATLGVITKSCKLENNAFTLATLPAQPAGLNTSSKTKKFTYVPQAALQVADLVLVNDELDLSAQATVAKGELNPAAVGEAAAYATWLENKTTAFAVKTAGETPTTLVEGTDYNIAGGKITFLKAQDAKVYVEMTNEALPKFTGANAFKTTEFDVKVLEDVTIDASDITEGDITTAIATKTAGKLVKNITINLAKDVNYTVSAPIEAPASFTINGAAGATIDASAVADAFIKMSATPSVEANTKSYYPVDVLIKDVAIKGVKKYFFYDNEKPYIYNTFTIENAVIELATAEAISGGAIQMNAGGAIAFTMQNSTVYQTGAANPQYFTKYKNGNVPDQVVDNYESCKFWTYKNNTFYKVASGNWHNGARLAQKASTMTVDVENNIWVDCGDSEILRRMFGSKSFSTFLTGSVVANNLFQAGDANKDQGSYGNGADLEGVVTFTDAANGNFAGNVEMPFGATEPTTKPGDPRWTLTYTNAPQKFAITVAETTNGTAVADKKEAAADEKVTITVTPAAGFELDAITGINATPVEGQEGKYEFTMPAEAVTVTVTFKQTTGIQSVKAADLNDAVIYNLNGARVSKAGKGLYIINGKKVVIK